MQPKKQSRIKTRPTAAPARAMNRSNSRKRKQTVPPLAAETPEATVSVNSSSGIDEGSKPAVPLMRSDTPSIAWEIMRQLYPEGVAKHKIQMALTPGMYTLISFSLFCARINMFVCMHCRHWLPLRCPVHGVLWKFTLLVSGPLSLLGGAVEIHQVNKIKIP